MDQLQVQVVQAEPRQRSHDRGNRVVVPVVPAEDLAGDLDLLARNARTSQGLADGLLVLVVRPLCRSGGSR